MSSPATPEGRSCESGCQSCPLGGEPIEPRPLSGARFGLLALAYFIIPIVTALIGSRVCAGPEAGTAALGALAGLALGSGGCVLLARAFTPRPRPARPEGCHE